MKKSAVVIIGIIVLAACSLGANKNVQSLEEFHGKVPLYPDAKVVSVMQLNMPIGAQAIMEIQGTSEDFLSYYKSKMEKRGWAVYVERENFLTLFKLGSGLMIETEKLSESSVKATLIFAEG